MDDLYPFAAAPGKTDTSEAAADKIEPVRKGLETTVMLVLDREGPMTSWELAHAMAVDHAAVQPRTSELRARGFIEDSGERRPNPKGNGCIVWRIKEGA